MRSNHEENNCCIHARYRHVRWCRRDVSYGGHALGQHRGVFLHSPRLYGKRFTRLGRFVSKNFRCPEFGGGNFFPPQGLGWSMDSPGDDCKYMGSIQRLTNLRVFPNPNFIRITDPDLFKYPYAYIVEPGGLDLTDEEVRILREYLQRGGFIHADDFWGLREKANFEWNMRRIFPEKRMEVLPLSHPVFHTFFDIDETIQIPGQRAGCYGGPTWERPDDK